MSEKRNKRRFREAERKKFIFYHPPKTRFTYYLVFCIIISVVIGVYFFFFLSNGLENNSIKFDHLLISLDYVLTTSGILSGLIISFLASKVIQLRSEKNNYLNRRHFLTQKVHKFRAIANDLLHPNIWKFELVQKIKSTYPEVTFYDIRRQTYINSTPSKQAKDLISDPLYDDSIQTYFDLKALINESYFMDNTVFSDYEFPVYYPLSILEKWVEFECGNTLWIFFDEHKYEYENCIRLNELPTPIKNNIAKRARMIDKERFLNKEFSYELLSELGSYMSSEIIPNLYRIEKFLKAGFSKIITYLFVLLFIILLFGVSIPILSKIIFIQPLFICMSISSLAAVIAFILLSFYSVLKNEVIVE
ncbi:MAG: hypothetical protein AB7V36_09690 [Bacteroidales bacterium]